LDLDELPLPSTREGFRLQIEQQEGVVAQDLLGWQLLISEVPGKPM
jgi:hypothetical protein